MWVYHSATQSPKQWELNASNYYVDLGSFASPLRSVAADASHAYVLESDKWVRVIDIQDKFPVRVGSYSLTYPTQSLTIVGNYLYAMQGSNGIEVFDIGVPSNLIFVDQINNDMNHDVMMVRGLPSTVPNLPPRLINNKLTVNKGQRVTLTSVDLNATDMDSNDVDLVFTVSNVQHGQFEIVSNLNVRIGRFTQRQVIGSEIQFVHDGSDNAPAYAVSVNDGNFSSAPVNATINFNNNPKNVLEDVKINPFKISIGGNIILPVSELFVTNNVDFDTINITKPGPFRFAWADSSDTVTTITTAGNP